MGRAVIDTRETEVWGFRTTVTGTVEGPCEAVRLEGDAARVPAQSDGRRFSATIPLESGINTVFAVCERAGGIRRSPPSRFVVRVPDEPKAWVEIRTDGDALRLDASASERSPSSHAPIRRVEWSVSPDNPAPLLTLSGQDVDGHDEPVVGVRPPVVDGTYRVQVRVVDARGRSSRAAGMFDVHQGRVRVPDLVREHPAWLDRAVVYGVVPHVFGKGRLDDVRVHLDDLRDLGVDTLWLSPLMEAPDDDFGYAPVDFFKVRARFGGDRAFAELVDEAHARGMRVIVDMVANHTSDRHRYFEGARARHPAYLRRYQRDEHGAFVHWFDWENLPNLDYDDRDVREFVTRAFAHWVHRFDVDGFRVDAAWAVRERRPDFWPRLRRELQRIRPDLVFIAEASALDAYFFENGFDVAYDWSTQPGRWAWEGVFDEPEEAGAALAGILARHETRYAPGARVLRFLENNDTGDRFVTRHGAEVTIPAAALLLTLPGVPCIFSGQEVGAQYRPYDEGPPLDYADPHGLRPIYRRLVKLRRNQPALHSDAWTLLGTLGDPSVLAYVRHGPSPAEDILVVLNFGADSATVDIPDDAGMAWSAGRLRDLWRGGVVPLGALTIEGHGVRLLVADREPSKPTGPVVTRVPKRAAVNRAESTASAD